MAQKKEAVKLRVNLGLKPNLNMLVCHVSMTSHLGGKISNTVVEYSSIEVLHMENSLAAKSSRLC